MNRQTFSLELMAVTVLVALALPAAADDTLVAAQIELAQSAAPPQGGRPPREAFEACKPKAENDTCEVALKDGSVLEGTCQRPPRGRDKALVCVPSDANR